MQNQINSFISDFLSPYVIHTTIILSTYCKMEKNLEDKAFGGQVIDGPVESL